MVSTILSVNHLLKDQNPLRRRLLLIINKSASPLNVVCYDMGLSEPVVIAFLVKKQKVDLKKLLMIKRYIGKMENKLGISEQVHGVL